MSASIPFTTETFRPLCIKGNDTTDAPTEFDLCAVGGPGRARLKSIIVATHGLAEGGAWTPDVQESVIKAFETGAAVFAEGVTAVRNLTAPAVLCKKRGLIADIPPGLDPTSQIPIKTGFEYSMICGFWPVLSYELALAVARISAQSEIDPRFFDWLSTLLESHTSPLGTVAPVPKRRARSGIAGSRTRRANAVPAT